MHDTQNLLYDSTRDYLALKYEQRTRERSWTEEKERLIARIEELKDDLGLFPCTVFVCHDVGMKFHATQSQS